MSINELAVILMAGLAAAFGTLLFSVTIAVLSIIDLIEQIPS